MLSFYADKISFRPSGSSLCRSVHVLDNGQEARVDCSQQPANIKRLWVRKQLVQEIDMGSGYTVELHLDAETLKQFSPAGKMAWMAFFPGNTLGRFEGEGCLVELDNLTVRVLGDGRVVAYAPKGSCTELREQARFKK